MWDTIIAPDLRQRLIDKYVPKEPTDPLVYKVTAFYWLLQELVGNWKSGKRLTLDQKTQLLQLLVWNLCRLHQHQTEYDECESDILMKSDETFTENEICCNGFQNPGKSVPHTVDIHDIALCETSDEEEYDTSVSCETTEQIAQLVLACKEFQLKVTQDLGEGQACDVE